MLNSEAAPPTLAPLFPAGGQRGTSVDLGTKAKLWSNDKSLTFDQSKVKIAADAIPGTYWLRAFNDDGASQLRPFIVGTLPEVMEKEPNDEPKTAQVLAASAVVNGKLSKNGDTDCFSIAAKKGQTIVASLEANRTLKSPMDAVLQIVSPDGFVLEENHDFNGLDPQIAWPAPKDGTYIVRVFAFPSQPDTTIRLFGSDACIYRLTITTGGFLDFIMPLAVGPGAGLMFASPYFGVERAKRPLTVKGWNLTPETVWLAVPPAVPGESHVTIFHPDLAGTFRAPLEKGMESEGVIEKPGGEVLFRQRWGGVKGKPMSITAESRSLGLPVDPVIRVLDKDGKQLARAEPPKLASDTTLSFTRPADGEYTIAVTDLYGGGSPRHAFRLRIEEPKPDYDLALTADRFVIPPGKPLDVPVKINRRNGFAKPVDIVPENLPAGVKFEIKPAAKPDPNLVTITLTAEKAAPGGAFKLVGKVKDEPNFTRFAKSPNGDPEELTSDLWVSSTDDGKSPAPKKKTR